MKRNYFFNKLQLTFSLAVISTLLISCGTYQSVHSSDDDGIYSDDAPKERKVVVVNEREHKEHEENYFTKEVDRLGALNGSDILTDIESYKSDEYEEEEEIIEEERPKTRITYSSNEPWGYSSDADVVIHINSFSPAFYDPFWDPYWDYRWDRPWRYRWGFRFGVWGAYTYRPFWGHGPYGFYNHWRFNDPFFCPPYYRPYFNNRYYNNSYRSYRNGRRGVYSRNSVASSRRYNSTYNNSVRSSRRKSSRYATQGVRTSRGNSRYSTQGVRSSNGRKIRSTRGNTRYSTQGVRTNRNTRKNYSTGGHKPSRSSSTKRRSSSRSRSYTPSRSSRSYTPSRSSSSSRSRSSSSSSRRSSRNRR